MDMWVVANRVLNLQPVIGDLAVNNIPKFFTPHDFANTSFDKQTIANQKTINDNIPVVNAPDGPQVAPLGRSDLIEITSPMVGTFYRAAAPGEEPFVEVVNNVKFGQTICILEAMKLMNEIESEFNAEIVEILVENGTPVEFGQVLMRVKQS